MQRKCPAPHQASLLRFTSRHRHVVKRHITNQRRFNTCRLLNTNCCSHIPSIRSAGIRTSISITRTSRQIVAALPTHTQVETSQYHLRRTLPRCVHIHVHSLKSTLYDFPPPPKISLAPSKKIPEARLRINMKVESQSRKRS